MLSQVCTLGHAILLQVFVTWVSRYNTHFPIFSLFCCVMYLVHGMSMYTYLESCSLFISKHMWLPAHMMVVTAGCQNITWSVTPA